MTCVFGHAAEVNCVILLEHDGGSSAGIFTLVKAHCLYSWAALSALSRISLHAVHIQNKEREMRSKTHMLLD